MLLEAARLGNLFNFKSFFLIVYMKGHETCVIMALKTTVADDGILQTKFDNWVVHLNTILARGGGNLNDPVFKSSSSKGGGC